jgi:hypothetical protein
LNADAILVATPLYLTRHLLHDRALYGRLAAIYFMSGTTTVMTLIAGVFVLNKQRQKAFLAGHIEVRFPKTHPLIE